MERVAIVSEYNWDRSQDTGLEVEDIWSIGSVAVFGRICRLAFHWHALPQQFHVLEQNMLLASANWGLLPGSGLSY